MKADKAVSAQPVGLLRLKDIIAPNGLVPVSRSTWLAGIKDGRFPAPVKIGAINFWHADEVHAFIDACGRA
jgi:prophage regulatory protein